MGFRIRDKSLFWTISGWKNNWEPKILNMPRMIKSSQTAYITCRYDHHSYLRSNFWVYFSGAVVQKLLKNLQTILVRRFQSRATVNLGIEKYFQNPIHLWHSCWTHQARRCTFYHWLRKEEWPTNSTGTTNYCPTTLTLSSSSFMNSEITTSDKRTKRPIK